MSNSALSHRFEVLDSLRGLAALVVVVGHCLNLLPEIPWVEYSPMHNARSAVIFFFILSGFVLALPFSNSRGVHYPSYLVKRIFRIYSPYLCAVALAVLAYELLSRGGVPELGAWFNSIWVTPLTVRLLVDHVLLIGSFQNHVYNPVLWSLVHEMRISLVFPFICSWIMRQDWRIGLGVGLAASIVGAVLSYTTSVLLNWQNDYFETIHYLFMFIVGILLAKHRTQLIQALAPLRRFALLMIFGLGLVLFTYGKGVHVILKNERFLYLDDWVISLGAALVLLTVMASKDLSKALTITPLRILGEISYSLYLFHAIILFSLAYLLHGSLPTGVILGLAILVSIVVSYLAWRWIEQPSITLGRRFSSYLKPQPARETAIMVPSTSALSRSAPPSTGMHEDRVGKP